MFADVVGSTNLYEALGDRAALEQISRCLASMEAIIRRYR